MQYLYLAAWSAGIMALVGVTVHFGERWVDSHFALHYPIHEQKVLPMTVVKIMAQTLDRELLARGIRMARADCEAIMTAVIEQTAAAGQKLEQEEART